ncbi:hypothetical protein QL285_057515 [Trifolium repens]|nr:hypothetical protein QL285_057515 [Trifolium repens]
MATNNIIKLFEELLAINEQRTLVEQELKVMKEKRAKIVDATEAAKSALRERQKRTKEIMANAQQAVRKLEAAEANELSNSPKWKIGDGTRIKVMNDPWLKKDDGKWLLVDQARFNSSFTSDKGSIMTTSIIKLFTELLVIDEQIALIEQKLKVAKEKRAKKAAAIEVAEVALREGEKRAKELTAMHNRKQALANEQQALREFEAAKAINLLFQM